MNSSFFIPFLLFISIVLTGKNTFAQFANVQGDQQVDLYGILFYQPHGLDGSPYLYNEWNTGNVILENGLEATAVRMKVNILSNDLVYYNEHFKNLFIADKATVHSFVLKKDRPDSMMFIKYQGPELGYKLKNKDFVHLVHQGKITLLAKYSADVSEANDITSRDKIYPRNNFFILYNNKLTELKLSQKSLIKTFPEHKKEIRRLATSIHFRNKSLSDMNRLIDFFEEAL